MNKIDGLRLKGFWEWCGFRYRLSASENPHYWQQPNGDSCSRLPKLTLDNIFAWAVPKLLAEFPNIHGLEVWYVHGKWNWAASPALGQSAFHVQAEHEDDATALALVIEKFILVRF